ncbi:hypothetical protein H1P_3740002 [Hyella patelloides LEGE 07179]|uniref:Uncharacterized protein n=1 Tax=Hyella patelloides LEGE 07179 TaxID=945734 RepID=A0A563VWL6_9CYAN|nr:hypothetical protein [Hyella patelloides]VEP15816.1 hypothetical protein H1P_3740002 [Hyella patelloides LEGE 07179]
MRRISPDIYNKHEAGKETINTFPPSPFSFSLKDHQLKTSHQLIWGFQRGVPFGSPAILAERADRQKLCSEYIYHHTPPPFNLIQNYWEKEDSLVFS